MWFRKKEPKKSKYYDIYRFVPKRDITAYELAKMMLAENTVLAASIVKKLPDGCLRHLERVDD